MRSQTVCQARIEVSALGFGCVQLTTHPTRAEALRTLEHALACGITHFDVARAYGFGRAEGILGEFLRGKRDRVTVATKFGLQPPSGLVGNRWVIDAAKRILAPFPALLKRAKRHGETAGSQDFSPQAAMQSLHTSLRELGTDYVDFLLLHEATLADARSAPLLEALQQEVANGTVRAVGVASSSGRLGRDAGKLPPAFEIVQFSDNALEDSSTLTNMEGRTLITHSVFAPVRVLLNAAHAHGQLVEDYSTRIAADLRNPAVIGSLLLQHALHSNPRGVVLFSSVRPERISANAKAVESSSWSSAQIALFMEFVDTITRWDQPGTPQPAAHTDAS